MERKYRMTRIEGDYYFLANDGDTLCRVGSYEEDGSAEGITGTHWCSFVFDGTMADADKFMHTNPDDFLARYADVYGRPVWREVSFMERTRTHAIDSALKYAANRVAAMQEP